MAPTTVTSGRQPPCPVTWLGQAWRFASRVTQPDNGSVRRVPVGESDRTAKTPRPMNVVPDA